MSPVCSALRWYLNHPLLGKWEAGFHGCFVTLIVVVFSVGLLIRILIEKCHLRHIAHWRRHRKLTTQLLLISLVFIIFNLPLNLGAFINLCNLPFEIGALVMPYFFFLSYWVMFSYAFRLSKRITEFEEKYETILWYFTSTSSNCWHK
ncbi:unnamed protein product [Rotaria magnacalcarata]|uniref:Uncharacterized protein n=1 Tax=Rotaria magnacalcarata TaxID=392030 RepID=A0A819SG34_9BILA|nr:unnamed protein product [Rotaria magnacalcarata]CAF4069757.1 unnamed protein product [Rotaria magnacalcarata]